MSKCAFTGLIIIFFSSLALSQKSKLNGNTEDQHRIWVDHLNDLSDAYIIKQQKDSAEFYAIQALTDAKKLNYARGIAVALMRQSKIIRFFEDDFPKAEV